MEPLPAELLGGARRSGPAALERWEAEGERRGEGSLPPCLTPSAGLGPRPGGTPAASPAPQAPALC